MSIYPMKEDVHRLTTRTFFFISILAPFRSEGSPLHNSLPLYLRGAGILCTVLNHLGWILFPKKSTYRRLYEPGPEHLLLSQNGIAFGLRINWREGRFEGPTLS